MNNDFRLSQIGIESTDQRYTLSHLTFYITRLLRTHTLYTLYTHLKNVWRPQGRSVGKIGKLETIDGIYGILEAI